MRLVILFDMLLNPSFKMTTSFANIARTTASTCKLIYSFQVSIIKISCFKHHKSVYTGLLLNFKSFTSFSYRISFIKCLINRSFKIYNNWNSFHNDMENIKSNLNKNAYPPFLINKVIKKYLSNQNQLKDKSDVHYFELPYIGHLSDHIKTKLLKLCKEFCKENFDIKLVFNSFKIKNYFSYKDPIPNDLKFFSVYKFTCASCSSSYIGKTCRHFKTRIEKHIKKDNKSHILNIYTPSEHALTHIILFVLK